MSTPASRIVWDWRTRDPERERERANLRLKREGFLQGLVVLALGFVVKNVFGHRVLGDVLVILGAMQGMIATWRPHWLAPVRRVGLAFGRLVGGALTWLLLVPFFALVLVPVALILRLRGRDPLHRQPLPAGLTAWIPRRRAPSRESLQRQFLLEDRGARALQRPDGARPEDLEVGVVNILGLSAYYHDSAACLVQDGRIVAAAQEERFSRRKHDAGFPRHAVRYCLAEGGVGEGQLDAVVFYDKPLTKFVRILKTSFAVAPRGLRPFLQALPVWLREKLWIPAEIERELRAAGAGKPGRILFTEHHEAHAASAFFASPFARAAILTLDGVGEWATSSLGVGRDNRLRILEEIHFPHSLGLLYSAFTYYTGFKVNSGEYKLMGLAPYGEPRYVQQIYDHLLDLRQDGSFRLNLDYFGYADGLRMTNGRFDRLFGGPPRAAEGAITRREMDLARSIQEVTEEVVLRMARHAHAVTGESSLCLAGGVALNCVANGRVLREGPFRDLWIQPASGDAGGAVGAALYAWHMLEDGARIIDGHDRMAGAFLGPAFGDDDIAAWLDLRAFPYTTLADGELEREVARCIAAEEVVGLCEGRMEFGPRALGNRSIVADARSPRMQSQLNLKIKYRESFRPFAPSVLAERCRECFELDHDSPYMLLVAPVARERWREPADQDPFADVVARVNQVRSDIPAVTHVDWSARIQTVHADTNPRYHRIISEFAELTGCPTIINTSFNVRGEPIVCTPEDAYRCFMRTEMDTLVLGNHVLRKSQQPPLAESGDWRREFQLD